MSKYSVIKASPKIARASKQASPDLHVIRVTPQSMIEGISNSQDFLKAVHHTSLNDGFLDYDLDTYLTSFEIWYQDGSVHFYYVFDDEDVETHFRRQIVGYYPGSKITKNKLGTEKFLSVNKGDYIAMTRFFTKKDPIYPINRGGNSRNESEPYKPILNEIDSKSGINYMIQVLFSPIPDNSWSKILNEDPKSVDADDYDNVAEINDRGSEPIFWTEVRVVCIAPSKAKAETEIESVIDLVSNYYHNESHNQTLESVNYGNSEDLFCRFVDRKYSKDNQIPLESKKQILLNKLRSSIPVLNQRSFITTTKELSRLAHLPSKNSIDVSGVEYKTNTLDSEVPPDAVEFEPVSKKEKKRYHNKKKKN